MPKVKVTKPAWSNVAYATRDIATSNVPYKVAQEALAQVVKELYAIGASVTDVAIHQNISERGDGKFFYAVRAIAMVEIEVVEKYKGRQTDGVRKRQEP
jgi:hypothetical protein